MHGTAERRLRLIDVAATDGAALRIAVATQSNRSVDETFGRATLFAIYDVSVDACRLVELLEFAVQPRRCDDAANDNPDDCEDRVAARIAALAGCHLIFARRIGDIAVAAAMKSNIHPVELARDEPITALLDRCRAMLAGNPPPWLRHVVGTPADAGTATGTDTGRWQESADHDVDACAAVPMQ